MLTHHFTISPRWQSINHSPPTPTYRSIAGQHHLLNVKRAASFSNPLPKPPTNMSSITEFPYSMCATPPAPTKNQSTNILNQDHFPPPPNQPPRVSRSPHHRSRHRTLPLRPAYHDTHPAEHTLRASETSQRRGEDGPGDGLSCYY